MLEQHLLLSLRMPGLLISLCLGGGYFMNKSKIKKCLKKGVDFIFSSQDQDGSFPSYTFESSSKDLVRRESIFPTCLIFSSLNVLGDDFVVRAKKKKVCDFLISQKSSAGSFNYWKRGSNDQEKEPYPDDLDDTFCALSALHLFDSGIIDEKTVIDSLSILTFLECNEGGPYKTWLVEGNDEWLDIDLAVNSNVAYFLSLQGVYLENIVKMIERAVDECDYESKYYSSVYSVIYFISRFYKKKRKREIIDYLLKNRKDDFSWNSNALDTALALLALMNFGYFSHDLKKSADKILSMQNSDGSWDLEPFVVERIVGRKKYHSGSQALSTGFCIEALDRFYDKKNKCDVEKKIKVPKTKESQKIKNRIIKKSQKIISSIDCEVQSGINKKVDEILVHDSSDQITLLPFYFRKYFFKPNQGVKNEIIVGLGLVGLLGWVAYDIYDDLIDGDGDIGSIALANFLLKELSIVFCGVARDNKDALSFFSKTINRIEEASFWETSHCRIEIKNDQLCIPVELPDYGDYSVLASRSMGHSLGVVGTLLLAGYKKNSREVKFAQSFFENYIIARQLNDDMHDWEEDLSNGRLTSVVVALIDQFSKVSKKKCIQLEKDMDILRNIFWNVIVVDVCNDILLHTKKSRKSIENLSFASKKIDFFDEMIESVEGVAKKTLSDQGEVVELLRLYSK